MEQQQVTSLKLVPFRDVLENVVQEAHDGLQQLADRLPALGDEERKRQLLQYLQATRQRLQRLHVCAQWAHKAKAVNTCREVLKAAEDHGAAFVHAADEFFRLHEELRFVRTPLFDVSTALHIMQSGAYRLLPAVIEDELTQPGKRLERPGEVGEAARAEQQDGALRRINFLLRSKLLTSELPPGMRVSRVRGGTAAVAGVGGQYSAVLTLVPAPRDDVTLAKYRPPGEVEDAAALKEEPEVVQPPAGAAAAAGADQPSTSVAAATAAAAAAGAAQQRQGTDCWRWQLLSFELLPSAAGQDPPVLLPQQQQWLLQHIEQRMWAAADGEQLVRLGKQAWVTVPDVPSVAKEQQQQQERGSTAAAGSAPAPSGSMAPSLATAAPAAADSKGKQALVVKEEPQEGQQQQIQQQQQQAAQQQEGAEDGRGQRLPRFATSPMAAMHGILCQTAGRLALFSLLLGEARQLEGGSWKGSLKLSRAGAGAGSGLRLSYWQGLPSVSYAELQSLREGTPYQPAAAGGAAAAGAAAEAAAGQQPLQQQAQQVPPAVEVALQEDGCLAASSSPPLVHPLNGEAVQLRLPFTSPASLSADRLLLQAASRSAALQLAAVQAVLQRGGRLAPAGIHAELVPAPAPVAPPAGTAGGAAPPASPSLQLWCAGSLQLCLSVQLRTGRLLLAAGPALLESEQGSSAAAAVAAAQQSVNQLQRDAMSQPLPPGTSRGMLAASLVASVLARLSLQLNMRRRMDAAAAAVAACGLRRAALPPRVLQQHMQQVAGLLAPLSEDTLTLALPAFPPPADLQRWAQRHCANATDSGATRCFMLLDFGEQREQEEQQAERQEGSRGALEAAEAQQAALPRVLLVVCSCTGRGTVTRVLQMAQLPPALLAEQQQAAAAASSAAASRKRRASDAAAAAEVAAGVPSPAAGGEGAFAAVLAAAAAWCKRRASWDTLRVQLQLLPTKHAGELNFAHPQQLVVRLLKVPGLSRLEPWAAEQLSGSSQPGGAARDGGERQQQKQVVQPGAVMQLEAGEAEAETGAWRVDLSSLYFGRLPALLARQGVRLAPPAPDARHIAMHDRGLMFSYSLQQGHSVLTAIADLVRVGMLHLCFARLAGSMAANPLAAGARASAGAAEGLQAQPEPAGNGSLAAVGPTAAHAVGSKPGAANGQLEGAPAGSHAGGKPAAGHEWPLPGCGPVRLEALGLTHMLLVVAPPPALEGRRAPAAQQAPMRVTVSWANTLLPGGPAGGPQPPAAAPQQQQGSNGSAAPGGSGADGQRGMLQHIRCQVTAEPPLPEPVAAALAQQLEAGRPDLFLDSLCLAAHSAAAAAEQLTPEAQRAAGLLPGALTLLGRSGSGSSALRLRAALRQGERAATLSLGFHTAGYTLFQLQPALGTAASASAPSWLPALWLRLKQEVPSFAPVEPAAGAAAGQAAGADGQQQQQQQQQLADQRTQLRQAWVHLEGLGQAVAAVLATVAAPPAPS